MKIAAIHFGKGPDIAENEERLLEQNILAAKQGADLIVNPELSILPFFPSPIDSRSENIKKIREIAHNYVNGYNQTLVQKIIEKVIAGHKRYVVLGAITSSTGDCIYYNSALVIGPKGIQHTYNKRVLTTDLFAVKGSSQLKPTRLSFDRFEVNLGVIICGDFSVPLISRTLAVNGSDLIVIPAAYMGSPVDTLGVRMLENGIPFVLANCYNKDLPENPKREPESAIILPTGEIKNSKSQGSTHQDSILEMSLDLQGDKEKHHKAEKLKNRHPELYRGALVDLTAPLLRPPAENPSIWVITVSADAVDSYYKTEQVRGVIESASACSFPVIFVLPELSQERNDIQTHINFVKEQNAYLVCGFVENNYRNVSLFDPGGKEILSYKKVHRSDNDIQKGFQTGSSIESYLDLPIGRVGLLSGEDLLYPEVIEINKNAAVDIIFVSSHISFDGSALFEDIAKHRHINIAVADYESKGGIYTRYPEAHKVNWEKISCLYLNTQQGKIKPAEGFPSYSLIGMEALVES